LAVREATFLAIDSRKSRDTAKNETSLTTENSTIQNQIIELAVIEILLLYCAAFAMVKDSLVMLGVGDLSGGVSYQFLEVLD
jgi:hypothetical protein